MTLPAPQPHTFIIRHPAAAAAATPDSVAVFLPSDATSQVCRDLVAKHLANVPKTLEMVDTTVASAEDLMKFATPLLLAVYNKTRQTPATKFSSRPMAVQQTWKALAEARLFTLGDVPEPAVSSSSTETPLMPTTTKKPKTGKKAANKKPITAPSKNGKGRAGAFGSDDVITLLVDENPRRPGADSHRRFALYKNGMTVANALKAGLRRVDLAWDRRFKFIAIGPKK